MQIGAATMENSMEVSQKTKHRATIQSCNPTPGCTSAKTLLGKDTSTPMFITALLTIAKTRKQLKCLQPMNYEEDMVHTYHGIFTESFQFWVFATPWTAARQAPLSMGFSRQEYWSQLPCPSPGDLPYPGIKPISLEDPSLQADSLPLSRRGSPLGSLGGSKSIFWKPCPQVNWKGPIHHICSPRKIYFKISCRHIKPGPEQVGIARGRSWGKCKSRLKKIRDVVGTHETRGRSSRYSRHLNFETCQKNIS